MMDEVVFPPGTKITLITEGELRAMAETVDPPPEPPVPIPPELPHEYVGAHPDVETLSLDVSGYPIPEPKGPIIKPKEHGARGDGQADDTSAIRSAINAAPADGGTIELNGVYGIRGSNVFRRKNNLSIIGKGPNTGFRNLSQNFPGSRWRCGLEFENTENLVLRDFAYDGNVQKIGCLLHKNDLNTWFVSLHIHHTDGGPSAGTTPLAMVKGADINTGTCMVGCLFEDSWGDAGPNSGVRGYWGGDVARGVGVEHSIFRRCGHTGISILTDQDCHLSHVTGIENAGAGWKPEIPTTRNPDWLPSTVCWTLKSYFAGNGFTGAQIESPGQMVADCLIRNQSRGITSWYRSRAMTIKSCVFEDISEYGVFFDSVDRNELAELQIRNNTIKGLYGNCVYFHNNCNRFGGQIAIHDNKVSAPVRPSSTLSNYPRYIEHRNNEGAEGSPTDWKHP